MVQRADMIGPGLARVLAPNPSAMTGPGTNTYLLGTRRVAVIDPGPADPRHLESILAALPHGAEVSHILVTHAHLDHSALAPALAVRTGAPVLAFGPATAGRSAVMSRLALEGMTGGGEGIDHSFVPDVALSDGDLVPGDGWTLEVIHTPGHMGGHVCLAAGSVLFSGDHVMGWASSLVSPPDGDMAAYMASLARLGTRCWQQFLPGHGDPVADPATRLADLAAHRRARETAILAALREGPALPGTLAVRIYTDTPAALMPAATRNVLAHLVDLENRNMIKADLPPGPDALFRLL